jgi:hypothetical protein
MMRLRSTSRAISTKKKCSTAEWREKKKPKLFPIRKHSNSSTIKIIRKREAQRQQRLN